ncbi:MAG TPA: RNA 2',3'-cyclic phosphodiesterase [Methylocella sp.]|nr:RNA 2',3'-cyclic phosphodiesterase [Methylocella sp.]
MNNPGPLRVFIGLKIAPDLAQQLADLARPLKNDEVRLVPTSDIHLTLVPPWNEANITDAVEKLGIAVCGIGCFRLGFEHLRYGPTPRHPHLLWAECVPNDELMELHMALFAAYGQMDPRPFQPHVTLARIPKNGRAIARKFAMDQSLSFSQYVTSIELFQSPHKAGSGYQILASLPLGAEPHLRLPESA